MKALDMIKFGRTLTDRPYGKSVAEAILKEGTFPVSLDFKGVISLGSSFGDEVLNAIAPKQGHVLLVTNTNQAVRSCLEKVAEDSKIKLTFG